MPDNPPVPRDVVEIAVVFATYRRHEILKKTLDSYANAVTSGLTWKLIVVDNDCDDRVRDIVCDYEGRLPICYRSEERQGKNNALNSVMGEMNSGICIFTDDDICVQNDFLARCRVGVSRWPLHYVFGGRILPMFPGANPDLDFGNDLVKGAFGISDWGIQEGPEDYNPRMVWGTVIVRGELIERGWRFSSGIGPSGTSYVMGGETEFVNRMAEEGGYEPVFLPQVVGYHQIRPEQLDPEWLFGRSYRAGRGGAVARRGGSAKHLFGAPRYLYRLLFAAYSRYFAMRAAGRAGRIEAGMYAWYLRGMIRQFRSEYNDGDA